MLFYFFYRTFLHLRVRQQSRNCLFANVFKVFTDETSASPRALAPAACAGHCTGRPPHWRGVRWWQTSSAALPYWVVSLHDLSITSTDGQCRTGTLAWLWTTSLAVWLLDSNLSVGMIDKWLVHSLCVVSCSIYREQYSHCCKRPSAGRYVGRPTVWGEGQWSDGHAFMAPAPPSMLLRFLLPAKSQQTAFAFVTKQWRPAGIGLVSGVVSAIPIPNRNRKYRPDTDAEYWYRSKLSDSGIKMQLLEDNWSLNKYNHCNVCKRIDESKGNVRKASVEYLQDTGSRHWLLATCAWSLTTGFFRNSSQRLLQCCCSRSGTLWHWHTTAHRPICQSNIHISARFAFSPKAKNCAKPNHIFRHHSIQESVTFIHI